VSRLRGHDTRRASPGLDTDLSGLSLPYHLFRESQFSLVALGASSETSLGSSTLQPFVPYTLTAKTRGSAMGVKLFHRCRAPILL
jgi:hypothetical protein